MPFARCIAALLLSAAAITTASAQSPAPPPMDLEQARELLARPAPPRAAGNPAAIEAWRQREAAAVRAGAIDAQAEAVRQLADAADTEEKRYEELNRLAVAYSRAGEFGKRIALLDAMVEDRRLGAGRRAAVAAGLARQFAISGQSERAQRLVARGKLLAQDAAPAELELLTTDPLVAVLGAEATVAERRGDLLKAERISQELIDRALALHGNASLGERRRRAAANTFVGQLWNHGQYLERLGRRDEALALVRAARDFVREHLPQAGREQRAMLDYVEGRALASAGDYEAALGKVEAALAGYAAANVHAHDNNHALARRLRAYALIGLGREREAQADLAEVVAARGANTVLAGNTFGDEIDALAAFTRGDAEQALRHTQRWLADTLRWNGRHSSPWQNARALDMLVRATPPAAAPDTATLRDYVEGVVGTVAGRSDGQQRGTELQAAALERALRLLAARPDGAAAAFHAAEVLRLDASQGALLAGAAKMAAGSPELRSLIEREQALLGAGLEQRRIAANAAAALDRATANADEQVVKRQRADAEEKARVLAAQDAQLEALRAEIARRFPRYAELASPRIPTVDELQKSLRPDEVYVNFFPGREGGHAFLVRQQGPLETWSVAMDRPTAAALAGRFRAVFDSGRPPERPGPGGLDLEAGARLHAAWIAPLLQRIGSAKVVYLAASGALTPVPWSALPAAATGAWPRTDWAGLQAAFVAMPSASSLALLRSVQAGAGSEPLAAFADPSFSGEPPPRAGVRAVRTSLRAAPAAGSFDYRRVPPLPETLDEVQAIAAILGAPPASIVSGTQATRSRVLQADLSRARTLVFATHGLTAGEIPGYAKPGLAMAYEGRGLHDSILSVDDVAALRLNADIVLLSACNTGAASGGAGDTVSALARAFFAAGARSLVVTAWAVESESAKDLTVRAFKALHGGSGGAKAQALAQAQRELAGGAAGELYRHPFFWAPYFLVGEGSR